MGLGWGWGGVCVALLLKGPCVLGTEEGGCRSPPNPTYTHPTNQPMQGNARFKRGDFAGAVERYTDSLAYDSSSTEHAAVAYANRALARLKMGRCVHCASIGAMGGRLACV